MNAALAIADLAAETLTETKSRKPRATRKPAAPAVKTPPAAPKAARNELKTWAVSYIAGAALTSMGLNALAFGAAAPPALQYAAWGLGILVPAGVLALGHVASLLYVRGEAYRRAALAVGAIAAALLALSVWHCTESISTLTGSPLVLAAAMAVGIDAGMVACEVAATIAGRK